MRINLKIARNLSVFIVLYYLIRSILNVLTSSEIIDFSFNSPLIPLIISSLITCIYIYITFALKKVYTKIKNFNFYLIIFFVTLNHLIISTNLFLYHYISSLNNPSKIFSFLFTIEFYVHIFLGIAFIILGILILKSNQKINYLSIILSINIIIIGFLEILNQIHERIILKNQKLDLYLISYDSLKFIIFTLTFSTLYLLFKNHIKTTLPSRN